MSSYVRLIFCKKKIQMKRQSETIWEYGIILTHTFLAETIKVEIWKNLINAWPSYHVTMKSRCLPPKILKHSEMKYMTLVYSSIALQLICCRAGILGKIVLITLWSRKNHIHSSQKPAYDQKDLIHKNSKHSLNQPH